MSEEELYRLHEMLRFYKSMNLPPQLPMDIQTAFYHGIRQQIDRVLTAMGPARVDKGLSAFVDGQSNWTSCFFARAYAGEINFSVPPAGPLNNVEIKCTSPEVHLMRAMKINTVIPIRIVYNTFDGHSALITKEQLEKFIKDVQAKQYAASADEFLRSIDFSKVEDTPIRMHEFTCA